MAISFDQNHSRTELIALFRHTFACSEGEDEAALIETLVTRLLNEVSEPDFYTFCAANHEKPVGAILLSRMTYASDPQTVFILSPVAVHPAHQRKGVGQQLIRHGLAALKRDGVDVVLTYGDPKYYAQVGFEQITDTEAQPPLPLSYPHGWLGQSLHTDTPVHVAGPSHCVAPLNDPAYW